jgi:hypothetical protein
MSDRSRLRPQLTALEDRAVPNAQLQVINNSPYAAASPVDIYLTYPTATGTRTDKLNDLAFRSSSPYLTIESAGNPSITVTVSKSTSTGSDDAANRLLQSTLTLTNNTNNVAVLVGDPAQTTGANQFQFSLLGGARTTATTPANVEFVTFAGSPDLGIVDVKLRGVGTVANDLAYPGFGTYQSVPPAKYTFDVYAKDGVTQVGSFAADWSAAANAGKTYTVLASGFRTPPTGNANTFGLLAVDNTGTGQFLSAAPAVGAQSYAAGAASGATVFDATGAKVFGVTPFPGAIQARVAAADVTGDGKADLVVGAGPGRTSTLIVFDGATQQSIVQFDVFEAGFTGGVYVAAADIDGDGKADVIVTPDQSGGPVVAIYSGAFLAAGKVGDAAQLTRFFGIEDTAFRGGARAAAADISGDGTPDVVVAAGFGGGPRVAIFNGSQVLTAPAAGSLPPKLRADFFAFEQTLRNGVFVGAGDVTGDGKADVVLGGGPNGGPRVRVASGARLLTTAFSSLDDSAASAVTVGNFFAGPDGNRDGVRVTVKDLDGDAQADIVTGLGSPGVPQLRAFSGRDVTAGATLTSFRDLDPFTNPGVVYVG